MLIYIMTSVGKFDDRTPYEQHLSLGSTLFEAVQNVLREYYGRKTLSQFANFSFAQIMNLLCPLAYNLPLKFCVWGWGGGGRRGIYDEK